MRFHGFVDDEVKNALLASAWVNLLPSLKEGWGLAIIEAGALGVPSVAFREASGTTESVLDGGPASWSTTWPDWWRPPRRCWSTRVLRKELGEAAREFAEGFSWEATGARSRPCSAGGRRPARGGHAVDRSRPTAA